MFSREGQTQIQMLRACLLAWMNFGCLTSHAQLSHQEKATKPLVIDRATSLEVIVGSGMNGDSAQEETALKLIRSNEAQVEAGQIAANTICTRNFSVGSLGKKNSAEKAATEKNISDFTKMVDFYLKLNTSEESPKLFKCLVEPGNAPQEIKRLGWLVAAKHPSPKMAIPVSLQLSRLLASGGRGLSIASEIVEAAKQNKIKDAYPLMRYGLMKTGQAQFVGAMTAFNPSRASDDFLTFISKKAGPGSKASANFPQNTLAQILNHFAEYPPSIFHPEFKSLFYLALSKETKIAKLASDFLLGMLPTHTEQLALLISEMPETMRNALVGIFSDSKSEENQRLLSLLNDEQAGGVGE